MKPVSATFTAVDAGKKIATASVDFDNGLMIDGFGIVNGNNGLFVGWPSRAPQNKGDDWIPIVGCSEKDLFRAINEGILKLYHQAEKSAEIKPAKEYKKYVSKPKETPKTTKDDDEIDDLF